MTYTRRDLGKIALMALPLSRALGAKTIDSRIDGVQLGAMSYSFRDILKPDPGIIVRACVEIGLGEAEVMAEHCEAMAGAPQGRGTESSLAAWRQSTSAATWQAIRRKFTDAGIDLAVVCYNMNDKMTDEDIEYGFSMADGLGVRAMSTSTTLTVAKRIVPVAEKHKMRVGYHGHDETSKPNETARMESYEILMSYGKYSCINLDIGHFTAANYDPIEFIQHHHDKITHLHVKDRKRNHGPNVPWGTGDTPIRDVMQLLKKEKYDLASNIELEYDIPQGSSVIAETKKCFEYLKGCLD